MSLQRTVVEKAIYGMLVGAVPGFEWVRANQPGESGRPFGTYLVTTIVPLGQGDIFMGPPGEDQPQLTEMDYTSLTQNPSTREVTALFPSPHGLTQLERIRFEDTGDPVLDGMDFRASVISDVSFLVHKLDGTGFDALLGSSPITDGHILTGVAEFVLADPTETVREVYVVTASIQVYGDKGETPETPVRGADILAQVVAYAKRDSTIVVSDGVCLGTLDYGEIRDLAQVLSADWEGRAQMDMRFSARFDSSAAVGWIRSVDIVGADSTQTIEVTP